MGRRNSLLHRFEMASLRTPAIQKKGPPTRKRDKIIFPEADFKKGFTLKKRPKNIKKISKLSKKKIEALHLLRHRSAIM